MDRRILLLPVAAAVITGLVAWRLHQETIRRQRPRPVALPRNLGPAPSFLLVNQSGGKAKLEAYLGRTRLVLYFTGGDRSLADDQLLVTLATSQPAIASAGTQVLVVTPAPPQEVRLVQNRRGKPFPFPVLSDIDTHAGIPTPAHQLWASWMLRIPPANRALPDRPRRVHRDHRGNLRRNVATVPVGDPGAVIQRLAGGDWPM